jgi:hypothetical protein
MDRHLGAAVLVPGLRPHDELFAGLAAPVALVCRDSNHRSLYRHLILEEPVRAISVRFGRIGDVGEWRSLRRWRAQLLVSPTLWGWMGSRLGIRQPAENRKQGQRHLTRLLGEMRMAWESAAKVLHGLASAVRSSLSGLVHNRHLAWLVTQFRPGIDWDSDSGGKPAALPTQEDPGRGPPR